LQQLYLYEVDEEGMRTFLGTTTVDSSGRFAFISVAAGEESTLLSRIQSILLGTATVDHFLLTAPAALMSISPLLVPSAGADQGPEIIMTLVPA
jgi:hypothetical protein